VRTYAEIGHLASEYNLILRTTALWCWK